MPVESMLVAFFCVQRLAELEGTEVLLKAEDKGSRADLVKQLDDSCSAPAALRLKVGAQVPHRARLSF